MIERDFYPLDIAAEKVGCTVDDLLYLGARGTLGIYFLPAGLQLVVEKYDDDEIIERHIIGADEPLKLSSRSIELLEAGNNDSLVRLDFERDATYKIRRFTPIGEPESNAHYDFAAMFDDPIAHAKKIRADYSDVKISDVTLVVKNNELMSIVQNSTKTKINTDLSETECNTEITSLAYLDQYHPMFSDELNIAIQAWIEVLECNPDKPKQGSRKKLIENWLTSNYPKLPKEAISRIATLLNPDKNGGAPASD